MNSCAAVLGASGLTGGELLPLLCRQFSRVVAIGRRPTGGSFANLSEQLTDFSGDWSVDLGGVDALFIAFGTTRKQAGSAEAFRKIDLDIPLRLAGQAVAAGVQTLVLVSAVGANPDSAIHYSRVKGKLEEGVVALGFARTVILRPSLLLGNHRDRPMETLSQIILKPLARFMLPSFRPIAAADLATAMVGAAALPEGVHILEGKALWRLVKARGGA